MSIGDGQTSTLWVLESCRRQHLLTTIRHSFWLNEKPPDKMIIPRTFRPPTNEQHIVQEKWDKVDVVESINHHAELQVMEGQLLVTPWMNTYYRSTSNELAEDLTYFSIQLPCMYQLVHCTQIVYQNQSSVLKSGASESWVDTSFTSTLCFVTVITWFYDLLTSFALMYPRVQCKENKASVGVSKRELGNCFLTLSW